MKRKFFRKFFKLIVLIKAITAVLGSIFSKNKYLNYSKVVYVDLSKPEIYHRYYYNFCKYFLIEGYIVFVKSSIRDIYYLMCNTDASLLFKEKGLKIGRPSNNHTTLVLDDKIVSPDYFDFIIRPELRERSYLVPIGFHPEIYFENLWQGDFDFSKKRYKSLFMAGNFGSGYMNDYNERLFDVCNRYEINRIVKSSEFFKEIEFDDELDFFDKVTDSSIYLIEKKNGYQIPPSRLFYFLGRFDFFFALPGMYMPICHNIIEAMSVGTIPFLQEGYANLFQPPLENGINCITYRGPEDLYLRIQFLFSIDSNEVNVIRERVREYYFKNLSPRSIILKILSKNYSMIYLMAEQYSVHQLSLNQEIPSDVS